MDSDEEGIAAALAIGLEDQARPARTGDVEVISSDEGSIDVAMEVGTRLFEHRGVRLAERMRRCKKRARVPAVPAAAQAAIDHVNGCTAYRQAETINLDEAREDKPANHRFYCWTPLAMIRVCFGSMATALKSVTNRNRARRIRRALCHKSRKRKAPSKPLARSVRGVAADAASSTTQITAIRHAMAALIIAARDKMVGSLRRAVFGVMVLNYDETDMVLLKRRNLLTRRNADGTAKTRFISVTRPVMMLHCVLIWHVLLGANAEILQIPCAPAVIAATTARCILAAMLQRLPMHPSQLAARASKFIVVLVSDAAKACTKVHHLLREGGRGKYGVLLNYCAMHGLSLAINAVHKPLGVLGSLFCACNIIRRGTTFDLLWEEVSDFVQSDLEITLDKPHPDAMRRLDDILDLLEWDDPSLGDPDLVRGRAAREKWKETRVRWAAAQTSGQSQSAGHSRRWQTPCYAGRRRYRLAIGGRSSTPASHGGSLQYYYST